MSERPWDVIASTMTACVRLIAEGYGCSDREAVAKIEARAAAYRAEAERVAEEEP